MIKKDNSSKGQIDHTTNRDFLFLELRREIMGPSCKGKPFNCADEIVCDDRDIYYASHVQADSFNEIVKGESPRRRYGLGVLYPEEYTPEEEDPEETGMGENKEEAAQGIDPNLLKQIEKAIENVTSEGTQKETDDFDVSLANLSKQRSMGISFRAHLPEDSTIAVVAKGGRYIPKEARLKDSDRKSIWWLRKPVKIDATFKTGSIIPKSGLIPPDSIRFFNAKDLDLRIELLSRPDPADKDQYSLITVCLVNRTKSHKGVSLDEMCLFQSRFSVRISAPGKSKCILPYPQVRFKHPDEEEQSLSLLYRKAQTFAVGHGCAADWNAQEGDERVSVVKAVPFPVFETPSITPNVTRSDGTPLEISMASLAGLKEDNVTDSLEEVISLYEDWIQKKEKEAFQLEAHYKYAAEVHMNLCRRCLSRMKDGIDYLKSNQYAATAFRLANHAILLQQIRSFRQSRRKTWDPKSKLRYFEKPFLSPDPLYAGKDRGFWRPFQIAFLLVSLRSTGEANVPDPLHNNIDNRETVELIWFPTGGGKTEAYLGLSAFALFMRRLKSKEDSGTHVLMRYTLRLLTTQQFQRAAGLICAMEYLRSQNESLLGSHEYSIGIWLGNETTPGTREDARRQFRELQKHPLDAEYNFVLLRCPWCGAQIGPWQAEIDKSMTKEAKETKGKRSKGRKLVSGIDGLDQRDDMIVMHCADSACVFHNKLPVYVIDEDIYEKPPSLIIGTVDKFAMLAWNPNARSLFGMDKDGQITCTPPGLIIQDELHLITGPLGSMAGLYETVIEDLCTDYRNTDSPVRPKIISSTATIRQYREQIKALYARHDTVLFPPPGLEAGDSFFASYARRDNGSLKKGRQYIGIHAPNLGSMLTTQVRVYSSLLQTPVYMDEAEKDPWWTLLVFFNSLRELGGGLTLFQSDIPERIYDLYRRQGMRQRRFLNNVKELTGRVSSSEIPAALQELEKRPGIDDYPIDACLSSNIIEVGIDVDRLSLMCIAGQPKTTSQYIQVTGRVGRSWWERPGLIVTIYNPSKPRDRSHFEKFRSYHERLYAQVEPSSITPFTAPALKRALHAVMVAYIRQKGRIADTESPRTVPAYLIENIKNILERRVSVVDAQEKQNLLAELENRCIEWKVWNPDKWRAMPSSEIPALLRYPGIYYPDFWADRSWETPTSMRTVDAECKPEITQQYLRDNIEDMRGQQA